MKRPNHKIFALAAAAFLLALASIFAAGSFQRDKEPALDITLPESGVAGDAAVAVFRANEPLSSSALLLKSEEGKQVASTKCFLFSESIKNRKTTQYTYVAVIAFPVTLESGEYALEYAVTLESGLEAAGENVLAVTAPQWASEDIYLDARNTAIRTDTSTEKITQSERLSDILFSFDEAAPRFADGFVRPVESTRVTSGFGDRRVYIYSGGGKSTSIHYGIDFGVPTGTPVAAAGGGTVVMAEERISTGYSVVIEHLPGVFSLYYHLDELICKEGDEVSAGDIIGKSGATGLATGPHLHWEFRVNGEAISPEFFLNGGLAGLMQ